MLAGQVVVKPSQRLASVCRSRGVRERPREDDQGLLRRPEPRRHVVRVEVRGIVLAPVLGGLFSLTLRHATFPFPDLSLQRGFGPLCKSYQLVSLTASQLLAFFLRS